MTATTAPPNLPSPQVPVITAGLRPQGPDFYGWWYLFAAFIQAKCVFRASQETTTTTLSTTPAVISYDTVEEDPWSGWNPSTYTWTAPRTGKYQVTQALCTQGLPGAVMLVPALGGSYTPRGACVSTAGAGRNAGAQGTWSVYLVAGQSTVQGTGTLLNTPSTYLTSDTAGERSDIQIMWLGN